MVVHKIDNLDQYVRFLQVNPPEIKSLYQDMLINVTSFFRNPGLFEAMRSRGFSRDSKRIRCRPHDSNLDSSMFLG